LLKKLLWFSLVLLTLIGTITLSVGFYQALSITGTDTQARSEAIAPREDASSPAAPARKSRNTIRLVLLGDSIARGTGDETGKGFASYLPEDLKRQTPKEIDVQNIGIDGLQSSGLLELLQSGKLRPVLVDSDLLVLSIGGNDLRRIRRLKGTAKDDAFKETFDGYLTSLHSIMNAVRRDAAGALIIFVGLYNPLDKESSPDDAPFLLSWNEGTQKLIEEDKKAIFIPTYDLFKLNAAKYVAHDALHPNSAGYQAVSNRIGTSIAGYFNGEGESNVKKED
jgi:lysophospholipase L1-like esterase